MLEYNIVSYLVMYLQWRDKCLKGKKKTGQGSATTKNNGGKKKKKKTTKRVCLRCDREFDSEGIYNRICPNCRESNANIAVPQPPESVTDHDLSIDRSKY